MWICLHVAFILTFKLQYARLGVLAIVMARTDCKVRLGVRPHY